MLFAAFTPQPGYAPPRKSTNPWVIIAGICGGCFLIAVIGAFVLGYMGFKKFGPFMQRTVSAAQFLQYVKMHDYTKAETLLTPEAQAKYSTDWLAKQEAAAEEKLGELQNSVSVYGNNQVKSVDDLNKITDVPYTMVYARGARRVILHYDPVIANNKIADIKWNADQGDTDTSEPGAGSGSTQSNTN
jgi:hypothetical protein